MHRNFSFWFLKPQTKQNKQKSYQARETSCFGFHDSYKENISLIILTFQSQIEEKKSIMINVFPHDC